MLLYLNSTLCNLSKNGALVNKIQNYLCNECTFKFQKCFIYNSYVFATFSSSPSQKQKKNCNKKKQICKNITHYKYKPQQKYHSLLYHQQKKTKSLTFL